jgi:hypothetical protein
MDQFKRYWFWITILIVSLVVLLWLKSNGIINMEVFVAGFATALTLFVTIISHYRDNDKLFKDLFKEFCDRYDGKNDSLNDIPATGDLTKDQKKLLIDYFNLCAEEYMWVRKGRIPRKIWKSWQNGIRMHLSKDSIKKLYDEEMANWRSSYYGFFEGMKK